MTKNNNIQEQQISILSESVTEQVETIKESLENSFVRELTGRPNALDVSWYAPSDYKLSHLVDLDNLLSNIVKQLDDYFMGGHS